METLQISILGFTLCFLVILITSERAQSYTFLHEATTAPLRSYYDYIIVGGGTAGCPLAATLSANASVLLLERGNSPYGNPNITKMDKFWNNENDTSPTSPTQVFITKDGVKNIRARVLGGGSSISAGFYLRADAGFLKEAGLDGEKELVNESYEWVENKIVFKPILSKWLSAVREGLLEVGILPNNGFTYDYAYGTVVGGVIYDEQGNRHTAADLLAYANPDQIKVLLGASATKILFRFKGERRQMEAAGVVYKDALGNKHTALLKKGISKGEIILSAGAIGSPQLLMLSGVGPAKPLLSLDIPVIYNHPLIGQGLSDNPVNTIFVPSRIPIVRIFPQIMGITNLGTYIGTFCQYTTVKVEYDQEYKKEFTGGNIGAKVVGPFSSGYLELKNENIDDDPFVTFNYFNDPKDVEKCVTGIKIAAKVVESKSLSEFKYENHSIPFLLNLTASNIKKSNDNYSKRLGQYCKDTVGTMGHYHGGCQLGKVVDKDYRIKGINSIRVIDGSTFLSSPGAFPQATLMMLGRYMGINMLKERSSSIDIEKIGGQNGAFFE